jgi:hypothetical protein
MITKNQFMIESNHKIQTLSRSPPQKVRGGKWSARTQKFSYAANNMKIILKVMDFCKTSKIKNGPFSGPIYHQIHLDRVKKTYATMTSKEKLKKMYISDFWFLKRHHTLFKMTGRAFFKISKYVNQWKSINTIGQIACNIFVEGGKQMDANFYSLQNICPGWSEFFGGFCFWALILSDQNLISHDQSEFQIKKIKNPSALSAEYQTKNKGYITSFIFHDKLVGHTKVIVISVFCAQIFKNGFQRFSNGQIFKNESIMCV